MVILETESSGDDTDFGGPYVILIDNLEKGISPATIEQFIKEQISVVVEAHPLGSLFYGTAIKALISLDSQQKYQQLPTSYILPSLCFSARPLVVTDKSFGLGSYLIPRKSKYTQGKWQHRSDEREEGHGLKVVRRGSDGYRREKQLRELVMDFKEHQKLMFEALSGMEEEIKQRVF